MTGPRTGLSQRREPKRGGSAGNEYGIPHIANDSEMRKERGHVERERKQLSTLLGAK